MSLCVDSRSWKLISLFKASVLIIMRSERPEWHDLYFQCHKYFKGNRPFESEKGVSDEQVSVQANVLSFITDPLDCSLAWVTRVQKIGPLHPHSLGTVPLLESRQTNGPLRTLSSVS